MYKHRFLLLFLIFGLIVSQSAFAVSANADASLFKRSLEIYNQNNFSGSSRILIQLIKKNPSNGLYWFNLGNCYFMAKSYENATTAFGKVVSLNSPLAPAAKLYQSKALDKLGRRGDAKVLLEQVLQGNPPTGIQQEAKKDLEAMTLASYQHANYAETEQSLRKMGPNLSAEGRLLLGMSLAKQNKKSQAAGILKGLVSRSALSGENEAMARSLLENLREEENPYWLLMDFSYGSASNVYMDGRSASPLASPLMRAQFEAGYHFNKNRRWSEKIAYAYGNENPTEATELGTQLHTVAASLLYQSSSWDATMTPYFQNEIWDKSTVSQKSGLATEVVYGFKNSDSTGAEVRFERQQAKTTTYEYLTGSSYWLRPYYETGFKYFSAQLQWLMGVDGTQDINYSDGSRLPLTQSYQGPGIRMQWYPSERTVLGVYLSRLERVFKNVSLPNGTTRKDIETSASLRFAYSFSAQWRAYALMEYVSNVSSLEASDVRDKNYNATTTSVGVSWDVF
ncbi:tetratricopeptide repeat protein [Bdellovibrio sp. HCB337]|uniref:tetratricopeptide repeat protein n=1 Tax=Bdellovibrio sp. HCB337 TaxID=3394358 RepID=UPI0039A70FBA